jgi:hypothetical protein
LTPASISTPALDWPHVPGIRRPQDEHGGAQGLSQIQFIFLELPKYRAGDQPGTTVERWAYFFREAGNLDVIPSALAAEPFSEALEVARTSHFSAYEWDAYDRAKMAEQDQRGALSLAEKQGIAKGREEGREQARREQAAILQLQLEQRFGLLPPKQLEALAGAEPGQLSRWSAKVLVAATLFDVFETDR